MKKICRKWENSILLLMRALLYLVNYGVFFGLLGIRNRHLLVLSRTSVVITFSWIIVTFLLNAIYGGYDVGIRKSRPIVISLSLSAIMRDLVGYLLLNIMNRNEDNNQTFKIEFIGLFLLILVLHILMITLMTYLGNGFYFWVEEPLKTLLVLNAPEDEKRVRRVLGTFHRRYRIHRVITENDPQVLQAIQEADSVFLYDLPVSRRTELVNECYRHMKSVYFNPEIADILAASARQCMFDDMTFFGAEQKGMTYEQRIAKRLMDIVISLVALILSSPIFLISAICIKRCDGGSVFFRQKRATIGGKVFSIYKFRTMRENVENRSVTVDDDRITPIGKLLRKYRLDELPQFINILKGEMSVVGPRPEMMENVNQYTSEMPEFAYRLRVKAGLTGYAQIVGKYNTTSRDKLILDLLYIENFSVLRDIQLIFQTVTVLLKAEESTEAFDE